MSKKKILILMGCAVLSCGLFGCNSQVEITDTGVLTQDVQSGSNKEVEYDSPVFKYEEILGIESMTVENIESIFGKAIDEVEDGEMTIFTYENGAVATFVDGREKPYSLTVRTNDVDHVRGIKIGDSYESVISKFKKFKNEPYTVYKDENGVYDSVVLYGSDGKLTSPNKENNFAFVNFKNGSPELVKYMSYAYHLKVGIKDDAVEFITYEIAENYPEKSNN